MTFNSPNAKNNKIHKIIKSFQNYKFWQPIFLRIYFLSITIFLATANLYKGSDTPEWIIYIIWTLAWIGSIPFLVLSCLILIKSSALNRAISELGFKGKIKDFTLFTYAVTMSLLILEQFIPIYVQISIFAMTIIFSEWNFYNNKKILDRLKNFNR